MADTLVKATWGVTFNGEVTIDLALDGTANPKIKPSLETSLSASVTPDPDANPVSATKIWTDTVALSGGVLTIDMTALVRGALANLNLNALNPNAFIIYNRASNTGSVTIVPGVTNGYNIFGDAAGKVVLSPGQWVMWAINNVTGATDLPVVGATDKTIDFSSADVDATIELGIIAG